MSELSNYIYQHLTRHVDYSGVAMPVPKDATLDHKCSRCDETENLFKKSSGSDKSLFCSACLFFVVPFPSANEEKDMTIKQKDTLLIISPHKTIVVGDISSRVFLSEHVTAHDPAKLKVEQAKNWRHIISEFVLFDYKEFKSTALVIQQSRADRSSTFKISHSPDYIYLCGIYDERINVHSLNKAYEIVKDIPKDNWQEALKLKQRAITAKPSAANLKKLNKFKNEYPELFDNKSDEVMPLHGTNPFYFLGWAQLRDQAA